MSEKIIKADSEWRKTLTEEQFRVARKHGTEPAFSGRLTSIGKRVSIVVYAAIILYFHPIRSLILGLGGQAFLRRLMQLILAKRLIPAFFMRRTEVHCARCDAHGHVFPDGPQPTAFAIVSIRHH